MSVSLDRKCLGECKTGCVDCLICRPCRQDCTEKDCETCCKQILLVTIIIFLVISCVVSSMMLMYYSTINNSYDDFMLVIGIFWMMYCVLHTILLNRILLVGLKSIFPDIQAAFPKSKFLFAYLAFISIFIWYLILWLPKIIYKITKTEEYFQNAQIATFVCFMVHFLIEILLCISTCCVKFEPARKNSEKGTLN